MSGRAGLTAAVAVFVALGLGACSGSDEGDDSTGFPTRKVEAGEVTVEIQPTAVNAQGAAFDVSFDTHSVELDLDVAESATLSVGGRPWGGAQWSGDGPGGHHREGTLRFEAAGNPSGEARLTIPGLPEPVEATWALPTG